MHVFESLLALLLGASVISSLAQRARIPYPALLAIGGAGLALVPGAPHLTLPPDLILALFVAPVLLDAAYDASFRDLRRNWLPVSSLVLVAVTATTAAVACSARLFFPDMPWAVAIAMGALVAPPDAVAALAVLRQVHPPHRIRVVLEGESLLNDASALLIYRLALGAFATGSLKIADAVPALLLTSVGSALTGWLLAWPVGLTVKHIRDAPSSVIFQFVMTFGVWLLAERLDLSGVITMVAFGITLARRRAFQMPAELRVPSFAIWETATVILNVLAFTLIGLQLGPILAPLEGRQRIDYAIAAAAVVGVVIAVRLAWVMLHHGGVVAAHRLFRHEAPPVDRPSIKDALLVGWSGMRGIVTLAAAMALPDGMPYRDFVQLAAFVVVLGTLLLQGLTLGPLLRHLDLPRDMTVEREVALARTTALKAAIEALEGQADPEARRIAQEYLNAFSQQEDDADWRNDRLLRQRAIEAGRLALDEMRTANWIGDEAYRRAEEDFDRLELSRR